MIKVSLIKPVNFSIQNIESGDGPKILKHTSGMDPDYEITVKKTGVNLGESGMVSIMGETGTSIAGRHIKQVTPGSLDLDSVYYDASFHLETGNGIEQPVLGSLMPQSFYDPFKFKYNVSGEWIGQSNRGAIDYNILKFKGKDFTFGTDLENPRFFEFDNDLFFLCETLVSSSSKQEVFLYKQNSDQEFELVKRFSKIPIAEQGESGAIEWVQKGSPDACVIDDELVIAYRFLDRSVGDEGKNFIAVWRTDNKLSEWKDSVVEVDRSIGTEYDVPVHDHFVNNFYSTFNDKGFRLRISSGGGVICIAYAGKRTVQGGDDFADPYVKREMRTFLSFDKGQTFTSNESGYSAFTRAEGGVGYKEEDRFTGLVSSFTPQGIDIELGAGAIEQYEFNVNFALYYDSGMASFVMLKAGDPRTVVDKNGNDCGLHLMGMKTVEGDFSMWEPCLDITLTPDKVAPVSGRTYHGNSNLPPINYRIYDVDIAPGETVHDLCVLMKTQVIDEAAVSADEPPDNILMTHCQFTFVDTNRYKKGVHWDPYLGIGGKYHGRFLFSMSPLNPRGSGFMTRGYWPWSSELADDTHGYTPPIMHSLTACRFREQLVATFKLQVSELSLMRCYGVFGPLSNAGESSHYDLHYSKDLQRIGTSGFKMGGPNTMQVNYDSNEDGYWNRIIYNDGVRYYLQDYINRYSNGVRGRFSFKLLQRGLTYDELTGTSTLGDPVTFFGVGDLYFEVQPSAGKFVIYDKNDTLNQKVVVFNNFDVYDFMNSIEICFEVTSSDSDRPDKIYVMWRFGNGSWNPPVSYPDQSVADINTSGEIKWGYIVSGTTDVHSLALGNLQLKIQDGFEPPFTPHRLYNQYTGAEKLVTWSEWSGGQDNAGAWIYTDSNVINLGDGTSLRLTGGSSPSPAGDSFTQVNTAGSNLTSKSIDGFADSSYSFLSSATPLELVLENKNRHMVNTVSLFNLHGVSSVDVGFYNDIGGTLVEQVTYSFDIPNSILEYRTTSGPQSLVGIQRELVIDELVGKSLVVFSEGGGSGPLDHYMIVANGSQGIFLDRGFDHHGTMANKSLRLMDDSMFFQLAEEQSTTHVKITFDHISMRSAAHVGHISLGRMVDISDYVSEVEENTVSSFDLVESDFGRAFPYMISPGNTYKEVDISCDRIDNRNYSKLFYTINSLYNLMKPFPVILESNTEVRTELGVLADSWSDSPSGLFRDVEIPVIFQKWNPISELEVDFFYISFDIYSSTSQPVVDTQFTLGATIDNPTDQAVSLLWDLDEGVQITTSAMEINHTYTSDGPKFVQCLLSVGDRTILRTLSLEVATS